MANLGFEKVLLETWHRINNEHLFECIYVRVAIISIRREIEEVILGIRFARNQAWSRASFLPLASSLLS